MSLSASLSATSLVKLLHLLLDPEPLGIAPFPPISLLVGLLARSVPLLVGSLVVVLSG